LFETIENAPELEEILIGYIEELFGTEALVNYLTKTKMLSQLFD
jgi:hypothetical protein